MSTYHQIIHSFLPMWCGNNSKGFEYSGEARKGEKLNENSNVKIVIIINEWVFRITGHNRDVYTISHLLIASGVTDVLKSSTVYYSER